MFLVLYIQWEGNRSHAAIHSSPGILDSSPLEPFWTSPLTSALVSRRVVKCQHHLDLQGSTKDLWVSHSKAMHRSGRFHTECHITPFVALTWIMECVLLSGSTPSPGQLLPSCTDCGRVAPFHLPRPHWVFRQPLMAEILLTGWAPNGHYLFFIWCTIDFDRSAPWCTHLINGFIAYFDVCEITIRTDCFHSAGVLHKQYEGCSYRDKWKKHISRKSYLKSTQRWLLLTYYCVSFQTVIVHVCMSF